GRATDSARTAGDQRDATGELPARRCLRKLVSLERPVLDRERLALVQRAKAADGVGCVLHGYRAVVEIACGTRLRRVAAARNDSDARNEHDPRPGRVDRELTGFLVEVPLVVTAIPRCVRVDAAPQRFGESIGVIGLWIERDDERL